MFEKEYQQKFTTPEIAVKNVRSGDWIDYGWCVNTPVALDKALADRIATEPDLKDLKFRGGVLLWEPEIFKLKDAPERLSWNSWHMSGIERKSINKGFGYYAPMRFAEMPRYYRDLPHPTDVVLMQVTPMDKHGYFNFGPDGVYAVEMCKRARTVIVEVNENMPRCLGGYHTDIHISDVDYIVDSGNPALGTLASSEPNDVDRTVGKLIAEQIPNGACLQLGIGGMPNAVGKCIGDSDLKDLGVHTEMYVDAFVDLSMAGKINCSKKTIDQGRQVFGFAAGSQYLYDFIDDNPAIMMAPIDYINDTGTIRQIDNFMSINNIVDIDLYGQINAESAGTKHISGTGGQLDFVLGAYLSKGGKSFICCSSTFKTKSGELVSRIKPTLTPGSIVTDPRTCLQYFCTEFGMVNLKGLTNWERTEAIISVADPLFREDLIKSAEEMKIWTKTNKIAY